MIVRYILAGLGTALCLTATSVPVEAPEPFAGFEAKRIKPPQAGTRKRITVQIDPAEQLAALARRPSPPKAPVVQEGPDQPRATSPGNHDWFWDKISPDIAASGPGRLEQALQVLNVSGQVNAPRLQHMQDIARARAVPILSSTVGTNVSPALVLAVIAVESAGRVDAVSSAGAGGLMQLIPATAERFGVTDRMMPDQNIAGGVKYLNWLMSEFDRDPILVLAGYNADEGNVRTHQGVPPFAETRDYVPKVLAAFQVAKGLCATPPELISDGCVFVSMN